MNAILTILKFLMLFLNKEMAPHFHCLLPLTNYIVLGPICIASALLCGNEGDSVPLDNGHNYSPTHTQTLTSTAIKCLLQDLEYLLPRGHV